ncbi:MAG: DUF3800 domain-containing protein [Nocardioides sp.]|nr:DUF3800 domain-containing protein [Nocardioides sp.]
MLLAYVDESDHGDFRCFAAVVADEDATKELTDRLNAVVRQASVDFGIPATTEIHGHPLFHGKESWKIVGHRARAGIHERVIDAVLDADVTLLLRSVSERRLVARQEHRNYPVRFPAEQICFQHVLQRVNKLAERRQTYALVIADERGDRERHRERFATYQTEGTPGVYMHTTLSSLLDTVHFAPSHHSRMLQAADMLAFTYRRYRTVEETDPRAQKIMDRMWRKLEESGKLFEPGQWP